MKTFKLNIGADKLSYIYDSRHGHHPLKNHTSRCFKNSVVCKPNSWSGSPRCCCGRRNVKPQRYFCSSTLQFDPPVTAFHSRPAAPHLPREPSRNVWPFATSGSAEMWPLMKSHPIAVSPDHRGVFGALTGPMRASIWPWPHEFEWAQPWRGPMQIALICLSGMISAVVPGSGSERKWGARVKNK